MVSRFPRWLLRQPSWIAERNCFNNSESLCRSDASQQASAYSDLWFGRRCCLKNFKMAVMAPSWILELTYGLGGDVV